MSTHNICFHGDIRKIITWYPLLSRPMYELILHFLNIKLFEPHPEKIYLLIGYQAKIQLTNWSAFLLWHSVDNQGS